MYVQKFQDGEKQLSLDELHQILVNDGIQNAFLNVEIALRIFLTLMITNCTAERSFYGHSFSYNGHNTMPLGMIFVFLFFCLFKGQYLKQLWLFFSEFFSFDSVADTFLENQFFYC